MITNPIDLARIFLDPRGRSGRQFRIRPEVARANGLVGLGVETPDRSFQQRLFVRRRTTDMEVFQHVFVYRSYDTRRLARHADIASAYMPDHSLILDLGAYAGYSSAYFASQWPAAKIVAVEPDPRNYSLLVKNTRDLEVDALLAAAGADGWSAIVNPDDRAYAIRTEQSRADVQGAIPTLSIASLLARHPGCEPFICKADIEGAEAQLFSGDTSWIDRFAVVIVELHDWLFPKGRTASAFLQAVAARDRDFVVLGENVFSIRN